MDGGSATNEENHEGPQAVCWSGHILLPKDARVVDLNVDAYAVSGSCDHMDSGLGTKLSMSGCTSPALVLSYFEEMKRIHTKVIVQNSFTKSTWVTAIAYKHKLTSVVG